MSDEIKAVRVVKKFDFSGGNSAVSLVSTDLGGAANQYKTLLMKADDVVVTLSMAEFLSKFFDMWSYDASILAEMLGYSSDFDLWDEEKLKEKTTILKAIQSGDNSPENLASVAPLMKAIASKNGTSITDVEDIIKAVNGGNPIDVTNVENLEKGSTNSPKEEDLNMSEVDKDVLADLEKAKQEQADLIKGMEKELSEYKKYKEELEEINKAKAIAKREEFITKAKGYEVAGVVEDKVESFAEALMKATDDKDLAPLVEALETLSTLTKSLNEHGNEIGHKTDLTDTESGVANILKARKEQKSK